jgi:hypothetical protein
VTHQPTDEQVAVVDAFITGEPLVVEAGAGTGKTSTLKLCAARVPRQRGVYLAYNRALKDSAAKSFPRSVRTSTTHGLAFGPVALRYERAGRAINGPRQTGREVAEILRINEPAVITKDLAPLAPQQLARLANQTVARFCMSGSEQLEPWHVPTPPGMEDRAIRADLRRAVLPYAQRAWADITSTDGRLRFVHNHYLKIFQLGHPKLRADFLLVDEAQDLNPCVAALVADQQHLQTVHVGDRCQAINGWNGAIDAMRDAPGNRLYLSQSFRFGPAVAEEANKWLGLLHADLRLRGFHQIPSRLKELAQPDAVLCRTNAGAIRQVEAELTAGRRAALVGGGGDIRALAEAAIDLRAGRGTAHPELCAFRTWPEVLDYVEQDAAGSDLKVGVALIVAYGPDGVLDILNGLVDESRAEVVISTAHKSKGREWSTVRIADDFREPLPSPHGLRVEIPREDMMLAYVTVTRAQHVLDREGLAWVDNWVRPPAPDPAEVAKTSWIAAAALDHPEAVLPDSPDPWATVPAPEPDSVRLQPVSTVPPPAPRRPRCTTEGCTHLEALHHRGPCSAISCRCQRYGAPQLVGVA